MRPERDVTSPAENAGDVARPEIERAIDGIDWLRRHMRQVGMIDCADVLDEAFATSLKAYLDLREGDGSAGAAMNTN